MEARYVRWLLPVLLLAAFRPQAPAQTQTTGDTVVLSDTVRWTWEATAGEEKSFEFRVDMPGYYRICWGDDSTDDYRIFFWRVPKHQYRQAGSYEVKMFGFAPLAAGDTIPYYIVDTAFGIRMEMVYVEGGTFMMGCTSEQDCSDNASPSHSVTLDGFYIGRFEVTQGQWEAVMGSNPCYSYYGLGDDYPVYGVSKEKSFEFCEKLSAETGRKYRLPTEAEWEYAARGGQNADGTKYAGSNMIWAVAWYYDNSENKIHPVGQKRPNGLGLYDMSGNVEEWCSDWIINPGGFDFYVLRGGGWYDPESGCRVSSYSLRTPTQGGDPPGFRVVCEL